MRSTTPEAQTPTPWQLRQTEAVVRWYLDRYYGTDDDLGVARMFCDPDRVGAFAVAPEDLAAGRPEALFRLLVATTMFQRRQDQQILRVLRGISQADADELCDPDQLRALARGSGCERQSSLEALLERCDLGKDAAGQGTCGAAPELPCALKRHTVLLKRYGHFGKVPTSIALALDEVGCEDLEALRRRAVQETEDQVQAAGWIEAALRRAWRISDKIAAMYLSMLTNRDLNPGLAPWAGSVASDGYVVVDSNVDLFLATIGYGGLTTYAARAGFVRALAAGIDLAQMRLGLEAFNPRLVQQALYMFMSASNRRQAARDCSRERVCGGCGEELRGKCVIGDLSAAP